MKNFAIIIKFEEKQRIYAKRKTRTRASSRFEAVCVQSVIVCRKPQGSPRRCGGQMEQHSFFCYTILQNGPTGISKGAKLANVVKMLPKLGFKDKRKIPNRCFIAIWDSF